MPDFPASIPASAIGAGEGAIFIGNPNNDNTNAIRMSSAGDINGDGFDDFIYSAYSSDTTNGNSGQGEVWIVFGRAGGLGTVDLDTFATSDANGFKIFGQAGDNDGLGYSVSSAGDVNGDGFDDIILVNGSGTGRTSNFGGMYDGDAGNAIVVFGKASGFTDIQLTGFPEQVPDGVGFTILGFNGTRSASGGDVNNDGYSDLLLASNKGVYVVYGKAGAPATFADVRTDLLAAPDGYFVSPAVGATLGGEDVSFAGDLNGDGIGDFIASSSNGGVRSSVVIFGQAGTTRGTVSTASLAAADGFTITATTVGNRPLDVSRAGDVNGDGLADLIVGAMFAGQGGSGAGGAYVIFGKAGAGVNVNLDSLAASDGFFIQGSAVNDFAGRSVAGAGDVNGDGFDDLIVGAKNADPNGLADSGAAYVIFGKAGGFGTIFDVDTIDGVNGFRIAGSNAPGGNTYDYLGATVEAAGDVNGDGFADVAVATYYGGAGAAGNQAAYIIYGREPTAAVTRTGAAANQIIRGGNFDDVLDGVAGNDTLYGDEGNDRLIGGLGNDIMYGGIGDDTFVVADVGDTVTEFASQGIDTVETDLAAYALGANVENLTGTSNAGQALTGNSEANTITGAAGNDTIDGNGGTDTLVGGQGDDTYVVDSLDDVVTEGASAGTDEIRTALASYTLASANVENLTGTNAAGQALTGDGNANIITGAGGNDTLNGGGGTDTLVGGQGNDAYIIDSLDDVVTEGASAGTDEIRTALASYTLASANVENLTGTNVGGQTLNGDGNANTIIGAGGNDTLNGGGGTDTLVGGQGDDTYVVDSLDDIVTEGASAGTDEIRTALASYTLASANVENLTGTNAGGQTLTGDGNANTIIGAGGNDTLNGGGGTDTLVGGLGDDAYAVDSLDDVVTEDASAGTDEIRTALASYTLASANVENLTGTNAAGQALTGDGNANIITGAGGNDTLSGGGGTDTLVGGQGNDAYIIDSLDDVVTEGASAGTDEIRTALASYTLASANVENLTGTSNGGQSLTGDSNANTITGAGGNDTLNGGGGADTLVGGQGNDTYVVDSLDDLVTEGASAGTDEIRTALAAYTLASANVENLTGTSNGGQTLTGDGNANVITGADGNDTLSGNGGTDTLVGGQGDDAYVVDSLDDVVTEGASAGTDEIRTALASYTLASANVENLTGTNAAGQTLTGDGNANIITGAGGNDTLNGGGGTDTLVGRQGSDTYVVDSLDDVVTEGASAGNDEIRTALASYTLASANVENLTGTNAAGQSLTGDGNANIITGAGGNDTLNGGGGTDTLVGGLGDDAYVVDSADDVVTEAASAGADEIQTALASYTLASANVENLTGTSGAGQTLTGDGNANTITGAGGNDTLNGGGGTDTLVGGLGDDLYFVDSLDDVVTEGASAGTDEIRTALASYTLAANVERLTGTAASTSQSLRGNGLDNVIAAGSANDLINLQDGGDDTVDGGGGNDGFYFGAAFTAADRVNGGAGTNDQIGLEGDYSGGLTLGATTITNIEVLVVLAGFSYDITTVDANVAAGGLLSVQATLLAPGQSLTFNGSAETNGRFMIYGGNGDDNLTGGAGNDGFYFGPGGFDDNDVVNGGAGANDQLGLDGDYTLILGDNVTNVEVVVLLHGPTGTPNTFDITASDVFVPAGETRTIFALLVETSVLFNGADESDGAFKIYGGLNADTLTGGDRNDWIFGGNGADALTGGDGNDTFYYDAVAQSATAATGDIIFDFTAGDKIDVSGIDAIAGGANDTFSFLGSGAFTNTAGQLRVEDQGGSWLVQADIDGDGLADFELTFLPGDAHPITAADFTL